MDCIPTFTTERLILTPLQLEDAADIQQLFPHWEVVRYLAHLVPWPYPADGALTHVRERSLPAIAKGTEWHWMVRLKASGQSIGSISLYDTPGNNRGFWLAPAWQGLGYMSEACEVINRYWFETLERPLMQVPKALDNQASRRISEREGMRLVEVQKGRFVCGEMDKQIWELRREQWQANQGV
ncbi:GNAT family N-acetyltransferase [Pseudomonas sp. LJDD11]|uniref:GNAT family N-acetyltransferase n=1 Tax=unclassified Pseudomonas TaxID=196821 RepID=UPI0004F61C46|nr:MULTISPECIES: GNAT family N-acetyltransferase [unclassified Pseudomonas]MCQ9426911.1 GNAT family N-acetyltransferase [Pseudomonas sp. LJDD11]BAP42098.1 acetyltransferase, including N-acetylaseof ribosomal protein [Pseudomonas sp. StFLB209]